MPFGAIDEKVRLAGSYIIEFDLDAATVTQVYYSDNYNFTAGEYANNENGIRDGIEDKGTRKNYRNEYIIGWYKGDASNLVFADDFLNPILKVTNAEELTAEVINPNGNCVILLCIQGVRSGATATIRMNTVISYKYVLDSVTSDKHFKNQVVGIGGNAFIPGEDIEIFLTARKDGVLSKVKESDHVVTNSLFASVTETGGHSTCQVANFRHLENIDPVISGITYGVEKGADGKTTSNVNLIKAEQVSDMDWNVFLSKANGTGIVPLTGSYAAGNYYPVNIPANGTEKFEYTGKNRYIDGVIIGTKDSSVSVNAGVFGKPSQELTVTDLELRNFNISITGDTVHAGALVGDASGVKLTAKNVIAYNTKKDASGKSDDSALSIVAEGNAGGLIGNAGTVDVSGCAAAVYVKADGYAGGLIGNMSGGTVINSYYGGHTAGGVFKGTDAAETDQGRVNVVSVSSAAGGLIGNAGSAEHISYCYSSGSVDGNDHSDFLIGGKPTINGTNKNYGVGWMFKKDDPNKGKPIYPDIMMDSFVGYETGNVADANAAIGEQKSSYFYDEFWKNDYYPYPTIVSYYKDATGAAADAVKDVWFLKTHVGDWALPGELVDVVNTKD